MCTVDMAVMRNGNYNIIILTSSFGHSIVIIIIGSEQGLQI